MTSPKFAVGDRVRIYGCSTQSMTNTGTITEWIHGVPMVKHDMSSISQTYHPKQLRRLKPKPKAEVKVPREWKMLYQPRDPQGIVSIHICREWYVEGPLPEPLKTFSVREVIPGSASVTRQQLAKAWNEAGITTIRTTQWNKFCKALGLGEA